MIPRIAGTSYHPTHCLEKMISPYFDLRGNVTTQRRLSPAKQDILTGRLQLVVHDLERSRSVPSNNGLGVLPFHMDVRDIGVNYRQGRSVEHHAALHVPFRRS